MQQYFIRRITMRKVRLCALLLAATLSVTSMPAVGVSAAQVDASKSYAVSQEQVHTAAPVKEAKNIKTSPASKKPVKLGWVKKNNKWYYVTQKGNQTGWAKIDGNKYYFDKKGVMQTGLVKIGSKKYFFARSGEMKAGWRKINKKWYYFNKKTGSMKRGWQQLGKRWHYLNAETGIMETGWTKIDGKTYYFAADGSMYDGGFAYKIGKKYYYFEKTGALAQKEGWKVSNTGARYYAYKDGTVAVNKKIKGKMVNAEGVRTIKTNNEMDKRAQGYSSNTDYLVVANLSTHKLVIYKGHQGEWKRFKGEWDLTCGAPSSRTPCGQFTLCYKQPTNYGWKDFKLSRAAYVFWTTAGFMIHTILYSKWGGQNPEYVDIVDDRLGMNLSLSCIRLSLDNARFIYNNIPTGTRLVVYE